MDTQSVTVDPRRHTDGESGAVQGLTALERVNRIEMLLMGLSGLATICSSAANAAPEHQSTPVVWDKVQYLNAMILEDCSHEVSALWDQMRPLVLAAKEAP